MIDFSGVKSVVIPEGVVASIACAGKVLWQKHTKLPYKQELLYLESAGNQYIDTGVFPTDSHGYEIELEQISYNGEQCPIGCMEAGNRFVGTYFGNRTTATTTTISKGWGSLVAVFTTKPWGVNQRIVSRCNFQNDRKMIFNGNEVADLTDYKISGTISNSVHLFNRHYSSTAIFKGRLYYARISENNAIVRDFIPVLDWNDRPCMYDKVSGKLFYNKGIGEFIYEKPAYKRELAYLESSGTQWIDTGVTINTATDEFEFVFQGIEKTVYKWFFGEHDNNARFGLGSGDGTNKRNVAYGKTTYKVTDEQVYDTMHRFNADSSGVFLDDVKIASHSTFSSTSTLYLFNLNLNNVAYMSGVRVWSCKHKRNGVLIRDFIPVLDWNDRPCMYDKVSGEFFYNAGTGEFLAG